MFKEEHKILVQHCDFTSVLFLYLLYFISELIFYQQQTGGRMTIKSFSGCYISSRSEKKRIEVAVEEAQKYFKSKCMTFEDVIPSCTDIEGQMKLQETLRLPHARNLPQRTLVEANTQSKASTARSSSTSSSSRNKSQRLSASSTHNSVADEIIPVVDEIIPTRSKANSISRRSKIHRQKQFPDDYIHRAVRKKFPTGFFEGFVSSYNEKLDILNLCHS